ILLDERRGVDLREAEPRQDVLDAPTQTLIAREPSEHGPAKRQRVRNLAEVEACDLLDDVGLPRHVARSPRRDRHRLAVDVETEPTEQRVLLARRNLQADERVRSLRPKAHRRPRREIAVDVDVAGPPRAAELDDELGRKRSGLRGEVWVDTFLPAIRPFRPETQTFRRAEDRVRLEVRG